MSPFAQVVVVGVGTLVMRSVAIKILAGREIPGIVQRALRLVAPAVLSGLVAQTLLLNDGSLRSPSMWHIAAVGAALVAWFSRSVGYTLGAGMALLWVLEALPGL